MTLALSRHLYVEFVFDQEVLTWLACHRHAFEWLGGVVHCVVIGNLKAAIGRAALTIHRPAGLWRVRRAHGFLISPCRPRTAEHNGKVEQGVHCVARNFLAGRTCGSRRPRPEPIKSPVSAAG